MPIEELRRLAKVAPARAERYAAADRAAMEAMGNPSARARMLSDVKRAAAPRPEADDGHPRVREVVPAAGGA